MARPPGRPRGDFRILLGLALEQGPGTTTELCMRTRMGKAVAIRTLCDMRRAGQVRTLEMVRAPGVKRPVNKWVLATDAPPPRPAGADLQSLLALWTPRQYG